MLPVVLLDAVQETPEYVPPPTQSYSSPSSSYSPPPSTYSASSSKKSVSMASKAKSAFKDDGETCLLYALILSTERTAINLLCKGTS